MTQWQKYVRSRLVRNFAKQEDGTAAVEFSLIAILFFSVIFAIIEVGMLIFASAILENGLQDAARMVRTGQVQLSESGEDDLRNRLCQSVDVLMSCDESRLILDVRSFDDFDGATAPPPVVDGELADDFQITPGNAGDVVLIRAFYLWDTMLPFFGPILANLPDNQRLLSATTAFRNEPFGAILEE